MTGPVLSDSDPYYIRKINNEFIKIPCVFWKVVYYPTHKGLNAVGFMMSQTKLLLQDGTVSFKRSGVKEMVAAPVPADDLFIGL